MAKIERSSFPMLPEKAWWALRIKFKSSLPKDLSVSYLTTVLNVSENSVKSNILPHLRIIGLIDEQDRTQPIANKWRDDNEYKEACKEIRQKLYPDELFSAIDDPIKNREDLIRWFTFKAKVGKTAAKRMAVMYTILTIADPAKEQESLKLSKKTKSKIKSEIPKISDENKEKNEAEKEQKKSSDSQKKSIPFPTIHIDLQIHLSPESTTEQIDQIFSSMAKHLKEFYNKK